MSKVKELYEKLSETSDPRIEIKIVEGLQEKEQSNVTGYKPLFKIESTDGTAHNTKIFYGDTQLNGITNLNLNLDADVGMAMAHFTVIMPLLNITLPPECVTCTTHPDSDIITEKLLTSLKSNVYENYPVSKENIDQDSAT